MMQSIKKTALAILAFASLSAPLFAALPSATENVDNVLLPEQTVSSKALGISIEQSTKAEAWQAFNKKNGNWNVLIDPITQSPISAFGEYIQISGFKSIDESNIESASMQFITENSDVLNVNPDNLKLQRKDFANNKWYITYKQYYNGLEVLLSEVQLVITKSGKVMNFNSKFYNGITISTKPTLSPSVALSKAVGNIDSKKNASSTLSATAPMVLPYKNGSSISYKLVYRCNVNTDGDRLMTYVDANSGDIAWRYSTINKADMNISAKGTVKKYYPSETPSQTTFPYMYLTVGGVADTLDANGTTTQTYSSSKTVKASFKGKYIRVGTLGRTASTFTGVDSSAGDYAINWTDANSHRYERNMYYYANNVIDFFHKLDTSMHVLEKQFYCELQFKTAQGSTSTDANAYSTGDTIVFQNLQDTNYLMADMPAVFYHEFGHSVNKLFYDPRNGDQGMINGSCNEGTADVNSIMLLDEHQIGRGYYKLDTTEAIRDCKNTKKYPTDITSDTHATGQILAGAFWDIREATDLATLRKLAHYARYSIPDAVDFGEACYKWLIAVIIADEDNDTFADGTPHLKEILTAFNNHNIGFNFIFGNNFTHTPLKDTTADGSTYKVKFSLGSVASAYGIRVDTAYVIYTTQTASTKSAQIKIPAVISDGIYTAVIPTQPRGTVVKYWFDIKDAITQSNTIIYSSANATTPFTFLVGYKTALLDKFESNSWTVGATSDNATNGIWENGTPEEINSTTYGYIKPGSGYGSDGSNCYSTGISSPSSDIFEYNFYSALYNDAPDGRTSIVSPVMDLSAITYPVLKVYDFYNYYAWYSESNTPALTLAVSSNGGTFQTLKTFTKADSWQVNYIVLSDYITPSSKMKFKFIYNVAMYNQYYPIAYGNACFDNFEILTANDAIISGVEDNTVLENTSIASPNPFIDNVSIPINYSSARVNIYNQLGSIVYSADAVSGSLNWNGIDYTGSQAPTGIYYYVINSGDKSSSGTIVRVK